MNEKLTPHFFVSVTKSILRVVGFSFLLSSITIGVGVLVIAELISIIEELV
jgi:hypothetical protein